MVTYIVGVFKSGNHFKGVMPTLQLCCQGKTVHEAAVKVVTQATKKLNSKYQETGTYYPRDDLYNTFLPWWTFPGVHLMLYTKITFFDEKEHEELTKLTIVLDKIKMQKE